MYDVSAAANTDTGLSPVAQQQDFRLVTEKGRRGRSVAICRVLGILCTRCPADGDEWPRLLQQADRR